MSKVQLLVVGVGGWIVVHVGLVLFGAVLGGGVTFLHFSDSSTPAPVASSWGPVPPTSTPTPTPSPTPVPTPTPVPVGIPVSITFYLCPPFCSTMTNGETVHLGAAACGYAFELGMRFTLAGDPTGRTYTCKDRGGGPYHWVDIFFTNSAAGWAWQEIVGATGTIHIERSN